MNKLRYISIVLVFMLSLSLVACNKSGSEKVVKERVPVDIYKDGYNNNMIVGFDEYGRSVSAAAGEREKRDVGIFYFLWLGQPMMPKIYDVSKLLEEYGKDEVFHKVTDNSPNATAHWWSEPLYGYYSSADEWVIRRHMELLTSAGVDFLVFDTTNALTYDIVNKRILKVISELRNEGWDCPQVVFYTHSYSIKTINALYDNLYSKDVYPDSWYTVDGKPMIIGYDTPEKDAAEAESRGDEAFKPTPMSDEVRNFFHIREARWPNDPVGDNTFPYTEWVYPQPLNGNMISVSIATHPMVPFSFSLTHENWCNWGRGFDVKTKTNKHEDIYKGTFFQSQWNTVFELDPELVFVTGWNEWIAYKQPYGGEYMLCDNVDLEYSRDAEPAKGLYEDAYYIQLMYNIRRYKYNSVEGLYDEPVRKTIDISGEINAWDEVDAVYRHIGNTNYKRSSYGGAKDIKYTQDPVRNNILTVKTTYDDTNLYFLIEASEDIVVSSDDNWMNIFIGTGTPCVKGWESYEYAINRRRDGNNAYIEKLSEDGSGAVIDMAEYSVSGKYMQFKIPRAFVDLTNAKDFYFKVADGVEAPNDIMSYYESGRAMPMGRLSYLYHMDKK